MRITQEDIATCRSDIEAIAARQWAETGDGRSPPAPNWNLYYALERKDALIVLIGRQDGRLVGYMGIVIHPQLDSVGLRQASISTYWIEPSAARVFRLRKFFSEAISRARVQGVNRVTVDTEAEHSCGRLLERLGFRQRSISYVLPMEV